ncbi:NAD-dependent epimerase [Marivirga lumbricoides]|uniref:NAD-dependent epimerase n=1 Tax=Marivirga lumbricoides TaxID=1046115 RepID=A0ABQ1N113_9BACT|nr:NAD-dependent epimerase [Marivirga lumbricoides]
MPSKKVLLTGATGLLGSNLLHHLIREGYHVFAIKRNKSDLSLCPESSKITWINIDSIDVESVIGLNIPFNYIIHAAGFISYQKKDKAKLFEVNTKLTTKMGIAALKLNVEKFILVSSISAIGKQDPSKILDETTPWDKNQFSSNYGRSKKAAEESIKTLSKEKGLPYLIFNPSIIVGPAKPDQSSARLIGYVADGKPFYTSGMLNYIFVDDVSSAIIKGIKSSYINQQWILNGGWISYKGFFSIVANYMNVKPPQYNVPKFAVLAGALLENIYSRIKGKTPTLSMETARMAGSKNIYSAAKVKRDIKIDFSPLADAVKNTIDTMKINDWLKTIIFIPALLILTL